MAVAKKAPRVGRVPDVRAGDQVIVLTGKDAGKSGKVEHVVGGRKVVVEGLNIAKRHTKPRQRQGRTERQPRIQQGGILEIAQPLQISNVMVVCGSCHRPTRAQHTIAADGRTIRVCRHCGEAMTHVEKGKS
ncbi:MAG: 50S ribosomal protein L24 [Candidatus Limnocylindrales bacterium]